MRIGEVIGTVTLSRWHPSLAGARFKLVVPLSLADLAGWLGSSAGGLGSSGASPQKVARHSGEPAEEIVVYDELGAGCGSRIAVSEGREAAQPFYPDTKPIDAYNAAILDAVRLETENTD